MQAELNLFSGPELKADGQARVMENEPQTWRDHVLAVLWDLVRKCVLLTADDLREACVSRGIPEPYHPNVWGGIFTSAARSEWIEKAGYRPSQYPGNRARVLTVWRSLVFGA